MKQTYRKLPAVERRKKFSLPQDYPNKGFFLKQKRVAAPKFFDFIGGRYWDRTSDPCRVKAVLYR